MANFLALLRYLIGKLLLRKYLLAYGLVMFALGFITAQTLATSRQVADETAQNEATAPDVPVQRRVFVAPEAPLKAPKIAAGEAQKVQLVIERGDTLIGVLTKAGIDSKEAFAVTRALKKVYDVRSINVGDELYATFRENQQSGDLEFTSLIVEKSDYRLTLLKQENGEFDAQRQEKKLERHVNRAGGVISSSLFQLATELEVPSSVMMEAIKAYSYDVDFQRDIRNGNNFEVVYETYVDDKGQFVREGDMLFASLLVNGEELKIFRFTTPDGDTDYYTEDGHSVKKALLRTPINGARISSGFGMRRHPVLGYSRMHKGVDFAAPRGTPVYAAGDGTIDMIGRRGGYGNYVRIRHNPEYSTAYAHLYKFANGMKRGRHVKQGQVIAYSGSTGVSTGPHLHYEVLIAGRQVNPNKVKMTPGRKLDKRELATFNDAKKKMIALRSSLPLRSQVARN
jgi:murein DD-endopeptidase MepM/ murein hydrolase activator NlpD